MNRYRRETGDHNVDFDDLKVPTPRELATLYLNSASARRRARQYRATFDLPPVPGQISLAKDTLAIAAKWRKAARPLPS